MKLKKWGISIIMDKHVLSFESFKSYLDSIRNLWSFEDEMNTVIRTHGGDDCSIWPSGWTDILSLLEFIFNDKEEWISYWIYELDWGKEYEDGSILNKNGSVIKLETEKELYDFLLKNMEDCKK